MQKLKGFSLFVMVFLCLLATQSLWSQDFSVKIYIADGSGWTDSVTIGKFAAATFGIDGGLGETELPPVPPGGVNQAPDFRSIDPTLSVNRLNYEIRNQQVQRVTKRR